MAGVESSTRRSKEKPLQKKPNAAHRKYSRFEDQFKVVERDWRAVPLFVLKRNWEVLGEEGELYRSSDIGGKRLNDRLRKRA